MTNTAQAAPDAVYRFYNRETGTHFYTTSVSERDGVIRAFAQFAYEGAAFAALGAGMLRASLGSYTVASMISGGLCLVAAVIVLRINRGERPVAAQAA